MFYTKLTLGLAALFLFCTNCKTPQAAVANSHTPIQGQTLVWEENF
ncbi:MAG: hypothetical protein RLZZ292_3022, partial [Bacteroidota bacterium]